jgi:hypothetical protein
MIVSKAFALVAALAFTTFAGVGVSTALVDDTCILMVTNNGPSSFPSTRCFVEGQACVSNGLDCEHDTWSGSAGEVLIGCFCGGDHTAPDPITTCKGRVILQQGGWTVACVKKTCTGTCDANPFPQGEERTACKCEPPPVDD